MTDERFTTWGNKVRDNGKLLNIEFKSEIDAKLCCKLLNRLHKEKMEWVKYVDEICEWHKEHYGKSILDERLGC